MLRKNTLRLLSLGAMASSLLAFSPHASALVQSINCTTPTNAGLVVSGSVTNIQPSGSCTTNLTAVSDTGLVAGSEQSPNTSAGVPTGQSSYTTFELNTNNFTYNATSKGYSILPVTGGNTFPTRGNIVSINSSGNYVTSYDPTGGGGSPTPYDVYTSTGTYSVLPASVTPVALGNNNSVAGDYTTGAGLTEAAYVAAGSGAITATFDSTGLGSQAAAVNATGQVAGTQVMNSSGATEAFYTGTNGSGEHLLGTAGATSSAATVINSNGQVGGYITLASGQTQAFLTTAHGGLLVGLGVGASTDNTEVTALNDSGQAIVNDLTSNTQYLYSSGVLVPLSSFFTNTSNCTGSCGMQGAFGVDNYGRVFFNDPGMITVNTANYTQSTLLNLQSATLYTSTSTYQSVSTAQGGATPGTSFSSTTPPAAPSVPAPLSFGLALLGLGLIALRGRKTVTGGLLA